MQKSTSVKPDVWMKKLSPFLIPGKIVAPKMVNINDKLKFNNSGTLDYFKQPIKVRSRVIISYGYMILLN